MPEPLTLTLAETSFSYRPSGAYLLDGDPVDPALVVRSIPGGLEIMRDLVSVGDYRRCVADGACVSADISPAAPDNLPVTGVSYSDANDYASWLSGKTGSVWRLPTDPEWRFAAAERAVDDATGISDPEDPSERWLAAYRKSADIDRAAGPRPLPLGAFGTNSMGLRDLSGNVWEWTSECYSRVTLDEDGRAGKTVANCGVFAVEGAHRAYLSYFIRDARGGGCSAGTPPDNLGFRLVREPRGLDRVWTGLRRVFS